MPEHRLHREIVTTTVVNDVRQPLRHHVLPPAVEETGAGSADLIRRRSPPVPCSAPTRWTRRSAASTTTSPRRPRPRCGWRCAPWSSGATRWLVSTGRDRWTSAAASPGRGRRRGARRAAGGSGRRARPRRWPKRAGQHGRRGCPPGWPSGSRRLPAAYGALTVDLDRRRTGLDPVRVAQVHFVLAQRLWLDRLLSRIIGCRATTNGRAWRGRAARRPAHGARGADRGGARSRAHGRRRRSGLRRGERAGRGLGAHATPASVEAVTLLRSVGGGRADLARVLGGPAGSAGSPRPGFAGS